jgi:hypothetical protein
MWPHAVVAVKPLIQICLLFLERGEALLPEGLPEELVEDNQVESLYKAIGPAPLNQGPAILHVAER